MGLQSSTYIRRSSDVKHRQLGPSYLLSRDGHLYEINEFAKSIWLLLDRELSVEFVIESVMNQYVGSKLELEIEKDILNWIHQMEQFGLIRISEI